MTLQLTDADRDALLTAVRTAVPGLTVSAGSAASGPAGDIVFLAGSMVDGLANDASDLDVYAVSSADPVGTGTTSRRREKNGTIGMLGHREINLSLIDPAGLTELAGSFGACLASLDAADGIAQLDSENDLKVLHRIRSGRSLLDEAGLDRLRAALGCDRLAAYLANLHGVTALNRARDVHGELAAGRPESAAWMFREALVHTGQLALALGGETNPSRKWLLRLLRRDGDHRAVRDWAADLLVGAPPRLPDDVTQLGKHLRAVLESAPDGLVGPYLRGLAGRS